MIKLLMGTPLCQLHSRIWLFRTLRGEASVELTETNNSKSVSSNPCATEGGIFQLFWTCDLLPFLHLHMRKGVRSELLKSARLVFVHWWIRMKVTSEEVDTDHVGQPVGPSV